MEFTQIKETCLYVSDLDQSYAFYHDKKIHYYKDINLGFAIDLENGLKVVSLGDLNESLVEEVNNIIFGFTNLIFIQILNLEHSDYLMGIHLLLIVTALNLRRSPLTVQLSGVTVIQEIMPI